MQLSDRVAVMFGGKIVGILKKEEAELEKIGLLMGYYEGGNKLMENRKKFLDIIWITLLTIAVGTILILLCGANPVEAYQRFFGGVFGNLNGFCEIFVKQPL